MILLGFRYPAPSIPSISLAGVAIGAGSALASTSIVSFVCQSVYPIILQSILSRFMH